MMAILISKTSGNFTDSNTWALCNLTFVVDSEATQSLVSTTTLTTPSIAPGAITIDGVALKLAARSISPAGTFTVTLQNATAGTTVTSVTVNIVDLPGSNATPCGWVFFKFSADQTLLAATSYAIQVVCSNTNQVTLYRTATTNDYSRLLRTTTTAAPAAGDQIIITNEYTGAGTSNAITVTMDNTATTVFGSTSYQDSVSVSGGATLTWGTSNSTNYLLTVAGLVKVWAGSTWNQGTSGTRIPSSSTATLKFSVASNVDSGFLAKNGSIVNRYGKIVTADNTLLTSSVGGYCNTSGTAVTAIQGQSFVGLTGTIVINSVSYTISSVTDATHLTLTGSAGTQSSVKFVHTNTGTVIQVGSTAGWSAGDTIVIASTTVLTDSESATILSVDSSTQVTLTAALTKPHYSTAPLQAEIIHLTRNVLVIGISTSLQIYLSYSSTSVVNDSYVGFRYIGSATTGKYGIDVGTITGGTYTAIGCTMYDNSSSAQGGWYLSTQNTNVSITYCHTWNLIGSSFVNTVTPFTTCVISNCIAISVSPSATPFAFADGGGTFAYLTGIGGNVSISINEVSLTTPLSINNLTARCAISYGILLAGLTDGSISTLTASKCSLYGVLTQNNYNMSYDTIVALGNTSGALALNACDDCNFYNITSGGDIISSSTTGVVFNNNCGTNYIINSIIGSSSGMYIQHTNVHNNSSYYGSTIYRNTTFGASTDIVSQTSMLPSVKILSQQHNKVAGAHRRYEYSGLSVIDTGTYNTNSPGESLYCYSASNKFTSAYTKPIGIANGNTVTVSVYININPAYSGNLPRLILKSNAAIGFNSDVVLATAISSVGSWQLLSGTTPTATDDGAFICYVDCDGTQSITIDDWSVS